MQNWQLIRDGKLSKETFVQRTRILDLMREWFRTQQFLEVETPLMLKYPGMEPHLNLFSSEFISEDGKYKDKRFLHTSPEYGMKKLLGAGFEKIFQITKVFRNGEVTDANAHSAQMGHTDASGFESSNQRIGIDSQIRKLEDSSEFVDSHRSRHNPEFTMIEWYRANADYTHIMDDCEGMIRWISQQLAEGSLQRGESNCELLTANCHLFEGEWERLTVRDAFKRYAGMDLDDVRDVKDLRKAVLAKGYEMNTDYNWDDLFFLVLLNEVEPHLGKEKPQFLIDYPATQAALACKKADDPFWAERFELYIDGIELCNAFTELVDPVEQRERLMEEKALRDSMGKEPYGIDEAFLEALETMPPSGGNALGIDRLVMVLLGKKSIEEVLLFPWADVS